jgi:hypothetical protein
MGAIAAREAVERAGLRPSQIDCVIFATLSPDVDMPASACLLQEYLDLPGIPAFDRGDATAVREELGRLADGDPALREWTRDIEGLAAQFRMQEIRRRLAALTD